MLSTDETLIINYIYDYTQYSSNYFRLVKEEYSPQTFCTNIIIGVEIIYFLCVDPDLTSLIHPRGIRLYGVTIKGDLNFQFATLSKPLWIMNSTIQGALILNHAKCKYIRLSQCCTGPIIASRLEVEQDFFIERCFCQPSTHDGPFLYALDSYGFRVGGDVILDGNFCVVGTKDPLGAVCLEGAQIEGSLFCAGHFCSANSEGYAINAYGIVVKGDVFLGGYDRDKIIVNDHFINPLTSLKKKESEFHRAADSTGKGFSALGKVCLSGASIGGALCIPPHVSFASGLDLSYAWVAFLEDAKDSWPNEGLSLEGLVYKSFSGDGTSQTAEDRLDWLKRSQNKRSQNSDFRPQPYEQLAKRCSGLWEGRGMLAGYFLRSNGTLHAQEISIGAKSSFA